MTKKSALALSLALAAAVPAALTLASTAAHAQTANPHFPGPQACCRCRRRPARTCRRTSSTSRCSTSSRPGSGSLTAQLNQRAPMQRCRRRRAYRASPHTGAFSVYPSTDRDGKISAWRGRTEVALESRDFAAASKLAGQLSNLMRVANVEFSLSPEAQARGRAKLTTEAIKSFRARADEAAKAFGYGSYDPRRERRRRPVQPYPRMMAMAAAPMDSAKMSAPIAVEGGKATVSVTVNGSVQMK